MTDHRRQVFPSEAAALYVHVPFCHSRCAYCDFNTYVGLEDLIPAYVEALCAEIRSAPRARGRTIYIGGGTPSILTLDFVEKLLRALRLKFHVPDNAEITLEANPGTVTPEYLHGLQELGINRLSLGIQSVHDDELQLLGRVHSWPEATEAAEAARSASFDNLNIDLMYGLPEQSLTRWQETLRATVALEPEHLSLYALTVEDGTPFAQRIAEGKLEAPDQDLVADMYELAEEMLAGESFFHYEISNWARWNVESQTPISECQRWPAQSETWNLEPETLAEDVTPLICRHNLTYWRNQPYLGFGAGAASWREGLRWTNVRSPEEYISRIKGGRVATEEAEEIDPHLEMGETMMMGLRLAEGVTASRFRARFSLRLETAFGDELEGLRELGLLHWDGHVARLTPRGRLLGNQVFQRFLPG
ncbi:MAG: radical SAM family heme chaperone HemW [Anaerolineae bacterium]|jgi:oxygen-independent coproporphyrinogen-3 oxidase